MTTSTRTEEPTADLAVAVGSRLEANEQTLGVAESCTGGLLGAAITAVPGSSAYFDTGICTYAYDSKRHHLGVSREALDEHGAVSEVVACEMARGIRDKAGVTWGLSTTGVAGPTGGTEETPVGTVYIGIAYAGPWDTGHSFAQATRYEFDGDRATIRDQTVRQGLEDLLAELDGRSQSTVRES